MPPSICLAIERDRSARNLRATVVTRITQAVISP
jgi:hypothetical protein